MKKLNIIIMSICTLSQLTLNANINFKNDTNLTLDINITYRKSTHKTDQHKNIILQPNSDNIVAEIQTKRGQTYTVKKATATDQDQQVFNLNEINNEALQQWEHYKLWINPENNQLSIDQYNDTTYLSCRKSSTFERRKYSCPSLNIAKLKTVQPPNFLNFKNVSNRNAPVKVTYQNDISNDPGESIEIPKGQFRTLYYRGNITLLKFQGQLDNSKETKTRIVKGNALDNFIKRFKNNNNKYAEITEYYTLPIKNK